MKAKKKKTKSVKKAKKIKKSKKVTPVTVEGVIALQKTLEVGDFYNPVSYYEVALKKELQQQAIEESRPTALPVSGGGEEPNLGLVDTFMKIFGFRRK